MIVLDRTFLTNGVYNGHMSVDSILDLLWISFFSLYCFIILSSMSWIKPFALIDCPFLVYSQLQMEQ